MWLGHIYGLRTEHCPPNLNFHRKSLALALQGCRSGLGSVWTESSSANTTLPQGSGWMLPGVAWTFNVLSPGWDALDVRKNVVYESLDLLAGPR